VKFRHAIPILYSEDILASLHYYVDILGFDNRWDWGDPPSFGGVAKDGVEIFFCKQAQGNPGTWLSLFVDNVDEYYEFIRAKGATVLSAPVTMEWGVREMLVADPDRHRIRFSQSASYRQPGASEIPGEIRISPRSPNQEEYLELLASVGWSLPTGRTLTASILAAVVFAVVAENSQNGEVVGCALLLGDQATFYYVKDVMVKPGWQARRIGSALMQALTEWLEKNAADKALVGLYTGENLAPFYQQFGFKPAFGMSRRIRRTDQSG